MEELLKLWEVGGAKVTETVSELLGGKASGVHEICPECLRSLDVRLSRLTHLSSIAKQLGTFQKGDRRVFSSYRDHTSQEGPSQGTAEENSANSQTPGFMRNNVVFFLVVEPWPSSMPSNYLVGGAP